MSRDWISEVKDIVQEVIGKPIPDPKQNLFDSGMVDSLGAVHVLVAIEEKLNVSLNVLDFARRDEFTVEHIAWLVSLAPKNAPEPS
jgi:D-alanine--poly(phosphoribitol) ligase subunit 2